MNTTRTLYRSTLVAAALAIGSVGISTTASAHDHGWHDRDDDHGWRDREHERGWRGHGHEWREHGWRGERGWYRGYTGWQPPERYYYPVEPAYREYAPPVVYSPPVVYVPAPRPDRGWGGDVAVTIHVPL